MTEPTFSLEDCEIAGELCQALDMEGEYKFDLEVVAEIIGAYREKIEKKALHKFLKRLAGKGIEELYGKKELEKVKEIADNAAESAFHNEGRCMDMGAAGNTLKARLIHLRHEAQINPDMHLSDYFTSVCGEFVDREIKQAEEAGL